MYVPDGTEIPCEGPLWYTGSWPSTGYCGVKEALERIGSTSEVDNGTTRDRQPTTSRTCMLGIEGPLDNCLSNILVTGYTWLGTVSLDKLIVFAFSSICDTGGTCIEKGKGWQEETSGTWN